MCHVACNPDLEAGLSGVVGRRTPSKDGYTLISRTWEDDMLQGKGELNLQMELRLLITQSCMWGDYPHGPHVITGFLKVEEGD